MRHPKSIKERQRDHKQYYKSKRYVLNNSAISVRRKREDEETWTLRKDKRQDQFNKRRNIPKDEDEEGDDDDGDYLYRIGKLHASLYSKDTNRQLNATRSVRKLLSISQNPPIQEVIDEGYLPRLVELAGKEDNTDLQFEALWALTNVASGSSEQTKTVVSEGLTKVALKHLNSANAEVQEQAIWAIGNIVGDGSELRDQVLNQGGLAPILAACLKPDARVSLRRNAAWVMSNFCRGKSPPPEFVKVKDCLPVIKVLLTSEDREILTDSAWALSYLTDGNNSQIQAVLDSGIINNRLIELCDSSETSIVTPVIRVLGNVVTGDDTQTQHVLDLQLLPKLVQLLNHSKNSIQKEACWITSNITAGNRLQIEATLTEPDLMGKIVDKAENADFVIKKEALWTICNATSGGSAGQIKVLVEKFNCLEILCNNLTISDKKIIHVVLEGISNILAASEHDGKDNIYSSIVEEQGETVSLIHKLCGDENNDLSNQAYDIITKYFENTSENEDENNDDNDDVQY